MRSLGLIALLLVTTAATEPETAAEAVASDGSQAKRSTPVRTVRKQFGDPVGSWGYVETRRQDEERPSGKESNPRLKAWIGKDVDSLIAAWGAPKRRHVDDNGNNVYVFANNGIIPTPGEPRTATAAKADEAAPIKFSLNFYCDVSFRVRPNKRIVGWRYVGNNCNWES